MVDQLQGHCSFIGELMSVYDTGVAGGTGGTSSECPCPSTWVITGIKVRAGQYIDRLSIMCTEVVKQ
jgi:hypothetical protein